MGRSEQRLVRRTIDASVQDCVDVAIDIENYAAWAEGVTKAEITKLGDDGVVKQAKFTAAAYGRAVTYELAYTTEHLPHSLAWTLVKGDIVRTISGSYRFAPSLDEPDQTEVVYQLEVELVIPVPGFVRRRAEDLLMSTALERFSAEVSRRAARAA